MYSEGRFFTVTGTRLNKHAIEDRTSELAALHERIFGNSEDGRSARRNGHSAAVCGSVGVGDKELIRRASESPNGAKFARLWRGQWEGQYSSQSEADLALCSLLAFWTDGDSGRIDRLFRQSGLMREKWNRSDYREATIAAALHRVSDYYSPRIGGNGMRRRPDAPDARNDDFASFPLTDTGNAERLALRHGKNIRYCHPQQTWWVWTGQRWEPDRNGHVMELAKSVARELYEAAWDINDQERKKQVALWAIRSESLQKVTRWLPN